jgi:hypothetical protein
MMDETVTVPPFFVRCTPCCWALMELFDREEDGHGYEDDARQRGQRATGR